MIVVPVMQQDADRIVEDSQFASRLQCPSRISGSPGRDTDDTASRIENVDIAMRLLQLLWANAP